MICKIAFVGEVYGSGIRRSSAGCPGLGTKRRWRWIFVGYPELLRI